MAAEKLRGWARLRPRIRLSLAAAALALFLVQSAVAVPGIGATAGETNAATFVSAVEQQVNLAYAAAVRLVNDFRLVYEVHSQLRESGPAGDVAPAFTPALSSPARACTITSRPGIT